MSKIMIFLNLTSLSQSVSNPVFVCDIFGDSLAILRAQTSPTVQHPKSYLKKRDRTDTGSGQAGRHDKQAPGRLLQGGGAGGRGVGRGAGEGTRAGLAPLTTGPGLPSNP